MLCVVNSTDPTSFRHMLRTNELNLGLLEKCIPPSVLDHIKKPHIPIPDTDMIKDMWKRFDDFDWEKVSYTKLLHLKTYTVLQPEDKGKTFFKKNYKWPESSSQTQTLLICGGANNKRNRTSEFDGLQEFIEVVHGFAQRIVMVSPLTQNYTQQYSIEETNRARTEDAKPSRLSVLNTLEEEDELCERIAEQYYEHEQQDVQYCFNDYQAFMGEEITKMNLTQTLKASGLQILQNNDLDKDYLAKLVAKCHIELKSLVQQLAEQDKLQSPADLRALFLAQLTLPKLIQFCLGKLYTLYIKKNIHSVLQFLYTMRITSDILYA